MEGEGPTYTLLSIQFNLFKKTTRSTCYTREGPVHQSASVLLTGIRGVPRGDAQDARASPLPPLCIPPPPAMCIPPPLPSLKGWL
jgi:hypothetical protein